MTARYLGLAITLAITLNHANRFVRAAGTLLAAILTGHPRASACMQPRR